MNFRVPVSLVDTVYDGSSDFELVTLPGESSVNPATIFSYIVRLMTIWKNLFFLY